MNLLIVGATGTLGRQIALLALAQGHSVRCLVRSFARGSFLKEKGAELVRGDITRPETLPPALENIDAVIDTATARATDSLSMKEVDWEGKLNLIRAVKKAGIQRYIFFSILDCEKHPNVALMSIKRCTEKFLEQMDLNYTIFQSCGFMQGLIGQYAIPILEDQSVWLTGKDTPVAYMNTQDMAKFALKALELPATEKKTFPLVGSRAWTGDEIIKLCERLSDSTAKISRVPLGVLRFVTGLTRWFKWTLNIADRLIFAEVWASGQPLTANMDQTYATFNIDPKEISTLEEYLQDYFSLMLRKIKEANALQEEQEAKKKKKKFFF